MPMVSLNQPYSSAPIRSHSTQTPTHIQFPLPHQTQPLMDLAKFLQLQKIVSEFCYRLEKEQFYSLVCVQRSRSWALMRFRRQEMWLSGMEWCQALGNIGLQQQSFIQHHETLIALLDLQFIYSSSLFYEFKINYRNIIFFSWHSSWVPSVQTLNLPLPQHPCSCFHMNLSPGSSPFLRCWYCYSSSGLAPTASFCSDSGHHLSSQICSDSSSSFPSDSQNFDRIKVLFNLHQNYFSCFGLRLPP